MIETAKPGFVYEVEHIRGGRVIDRFQVHNIMPIEGIHHMYGVLLTSGAQVATWYIGLYENSYTPQSSDVAATFATLAGEISAYENASRHTFVPGAFSAGVVSSSAVPAEFVFNAGKTVRGGFMASTSTKGGTAGVLLSAVQFSSPRVVVATDILRVTAGFQIISA